MSDTRPTAPATAPIFENRDPNAPGFWDERFGRGYMPWDQAGVPASFKTFVEWHAPMSVLIPGCGSAYEAWWLAEKGWPVRAIDFAPNAVEAARAQLGERAELVEVADFFTYQPPFEPGWIYERAFMCALPPSRRDDYTARMAALLPAGGLLAGFFFIGAMQKDLSEDSSKGPPFCIERAELDALLTPHFELLEDEPVSDSIAVFAGRERWLTWRRRGATRA